MNTSTIKKRAEGLAKEVGGKIQNTVGKLVGSEQMEAQGRATELEGEKKQEQVKTTERLKGKAEEALGAIKKKVGDVIDDEELEASGRAQELKGEARQNANASNR